MLDPYFSATKIKWLIENVEDVKKTAIKGDALFGTVDSWLLWNLTGGKVHSTDSSNASRTMLFNINTLKYDEELLEIFGIPAHILPEVKDSNAIFGYTSPVITGKAIPITGILGDHQAALFAQVDGGASKNDFLMQLQADILNMKIERAENTESTSLGVVEMAGLSTGFWSFDCVKDLNPIERIFIPSIETQKTEVLYRKWKKAVERSLKWASDL